MRTSTRTFIALTCLPFIAFGCREAANAGPSGAGIVRDSAGVLIVEHAGFPSGLPTWTVADPPEVRIGSLEGAGPEVLGRVAGLALLSGGTLVIADAQAMELRAFDGAGQHQWSAGRSGQGPGEFIRDITRLDRGVADSLLATDGGGRTMVFGPDGTYSRMLTLPESVNGVGRPRIVGVLTDGSFAVASSMLDLSGTIPSGYVRGREVLEVLDRAGIFREKLGEFESQETSIDVTTGASGQISSISIRRFSMGRNLVVAVGSSSIVAGETDRFELFRFDLMGRPSTIVRVDLPASLTDDETLQRTREIEENALVPDTLPAYSNLRLDDAGQVWVGEFVPIYEERSPYWWVIDSDGAFIARVDVPKGFEPMEFSGDQVWGIRLDDFDVPYVERRRIIRE